MNGSNMLSGNWRKMFNCFCAPLANLAQSKTQDEGKGRFHGHFFCYTQREVMTEAKNREELSR
jgi:hypothetical protein